MRASWLSATVILAAACAHRADVRVDPASLASEGDARYATRATDGERGPSDRGGRPVRPKVTEGFKDPPQTNDWWSSLIWSFDGNPYSRPMFPHPLAMQADAHGLGISYPTEPAIDPRGYRFAHSRDLEISLAGLAAPDARVARYSDWTVTAVWRDGARRLEATFGHGLPFVYARAEGGDARIELAEAAEPWHSEGEIAGITVHGHAYGLFAPSGATWRREGNALVSDLAKKGFFSIAALPDASKETLQRFRSHAYAFVDDTRATWSYSPKDAKVTSRFEVKTTLVEPGEGRVAEPILALYPHQWKNARAPVPATPAYVSPRGAMRILEAASFEVDRPFLGILPILPDTDAARDQARSYLKDEAGDPLFRPGLEGKEDSYWAGKSLGRAATMAWIARQLGEEDVEARLRAAIEAELEDWFDGQPPKRFVYDPTWRTLIGYPAGYQSSTELNDHHFHYGYFVFAAATLATLDPAGRAATKWAPFVRMLIDDVAAAEPGRFPRLRFFDPYAGHSWASGPAMFDDGNNEESSSEDANFAAALALWGMATNDDVLRDRGIFLYETLVSAIEQYWMDVDRDVFPKGYAHDVAGIVWGNGARYDTWWSREPVFVHGINVLPVTGASLYLGRRRESVMRNQAHLLAQNRGTVHQWRDIAFMYEALGDPARAAELVEDEHYFEPEFGNSWTATFHWTLGLRELGHVNTTVRADHPGFAVFDGPRGRTYAAFNPGSAAARIAFTDGTAIDAPPRAMRHVTRAAK